MDWSTEKYVLIESKEGPARRVFNCAGHNHGVSWKDACISFPNLVGNLKHMRGRETEAKGDQPAFRDSVVQEAHHVLEVDADLARDDSVHKFAKDRKGNT